MDTQLVTRIPGVQAERRSRRALAVGALAPLTALGGIVWALLQPWRITLLDPYGEGFWRLAVEPPLLVVLVGVLFYVFVARGVVEDLAAAGED